MRVVVIGAGASGLIAAIRLSELGHEVTIIDKNEKVGKKIYITGKGRCNLTNVGQDFLENVVTNGKFLYSALNKFDSQNTVAFFNKLGLETKVERGNRVFPLSDKSSDVIKALESVCKTKINIRLNEEVIDVYKDKDKFIICTKNNKYESEKLFIATGGMSYPLTGSTGSGYSFLKKLGHTIVMPKAALVPIILNDQFISKIEGLSLKNVKLIAYKNQKLFKSFFGEMLFTADGISGPIALSMSSFINKETNIDLSIDFKPALTNEKLIARIEREILMNSKIQLNTFLKGYLPVNLVDIFISKLNKRIDTKVNTLTKKDKEFIANLMKDFKLEYKGLDDIKKAIITAGGISVNEINPRNFESKIVTGLYIVGELLDVDALTGGYNLQIAWTTGYVAASSLGESL